MQAVILKTDTHVHAHTHTTPPWGVETAHEEAHVVLSSCPPTSLGCTSATLKMSSAIKSKCLLSWRIGYCRQSQTRDSEPWQPPIAVLWGPKIMICNVFPSKIGEHYSLGPETVFCPTKLNSYANNMVSTEVLTTKISLQKVLNSANQLWV